jgi:hypothetical protein
VTTIAATPAPPAHGRFRPLAWFLAGLFLVDATVVLFRDTWERHSPDDYAEKLKALQTRPRDFVLAGGSPVSEGLDPGVLANLSWRGVRLHDGYAIGLPGATTTETYHAVIHGCPTPPRLLIYGITASDLNDARHEPHGPYSLMTVGDWAEWVRSRPESAEWVTRHFVQGRLSRSWAVFRYRHGIRMWAAATADRWFPGCCPETMNEAGEGLRYSAALRNGNGYTPAEGFVNSRYDEAKAVGRELPPFGFLDKYRTGSHLKYLHKLTDWAESSGTDLVLLDMPVTADLEAKYAAALAEYRRRLAEFEAERGVTVLRADRDSVGLDDRHFGDLIHLNAIGARILSEWLRDRLSELDLSRAEGNRP